MDALRSRWDASVDRQVARKHGSMKIGCSAAGGVTSARDLRGWERQYSLPGRSRLWRGVSAAEQIRREGLDDRGAGPVETLPR